MKIKSKESVKSCEKYFDLRKYFKKLRFDEKHHLGLGDIRLTIEQQDKICNLVNNKIKNKENIDYTISFGIKDSEIIFIDFNEMLDFCDCKNDHTIDDNIVKEAVIGYLESAKKYISKNNCTHKCNLCKSF